MQWPAAKVELLATFPYGVALLIALPDEYEIAEKH
jgi:hypothetical protein